MAQKLYRTLHYEAGIVIDKFVFSATSTANRSNTLLDKLNKIMRESKSETATLNGYTFLRDTNNNSRYRHTFIVTKKDVSIGVMNVKHLKKKDYHDYILTVHNALHYYADGCIPTVSIFLHDVGLQFGKIIQLDVAIDHYNSDPQKEFWKAMKKPENKVVIKRNSYNIGEYIPHIETITSGTRENPSLFTTTYLKQSDGVSKKSLVLYDKIGEITLASNEKTYIAQYHFLREQNIEVLNRAEIRTSSKYVSQYEKKRKQKIDLEFLFSDACLYDYYCFHLDLLIRITDPKGRVNTFIKQPFIELKESGANKRKKEVVAVQF